MYYTLFVKMAKYGAICSGKKAEIFTSAGQNVTSSGINALPGLGKI
jgi:hypothetical protein